MSSQESIALPRVSASRWEGLGGWNLYFLSKFVLIGMGALNFKVLPNLLFAACLLLPLPWRWAQRVRLVLAVPVAIALYYHDTWFPPLSRVAEQPGIWTFSLSYMVELVGRFIDPKLVGGALVGWVLYLFVAQWVRLTTFSLLGLLFLALPSLPASPRAGGELVQVNTADTERVKGPADNRTLDDYVERFYRDEASRETVFNRVQPDDAQPFDLLLLNICSLGWSDLEQIGLRDHPFLRRMDIVFDHFNSATSYSGPAAIRLLRASCGQVRHENLYEMPPPQCFLFNNLKQLGFQRELLLNHTSNFQGYIDRLGRVGELPPMVTDTSGAGRAVIGFDGATIHRDGEVLRRWWADRQKNPGDRVSLFYGSITLHDGNRMLNADGSTRRAEYKPRAQMLLDDLDQFVTELEHSGRRVVLMLVPEHGASLGGDRMQISGMREIPAQSITQIPVAIKMIGMREPRTGAQVRISEPSSYLAVSELVSRLSDGRLFAAEQVDWNALVRDLPRTEAVSDNGSSMVLQYQGAPYVKVKGQDWLPYPR